jgi:hypothetical protein
VVIREIRALHESAALYDAGHEKRIEGQSSAGVPACGLPRRPARRSCQIWGRDAPKNRRRGRLRYTSSLAVALNGERL